MLTELSTCQLLYSITKERLAMTSGPQEPAPALSWPASWASITFRGSRSPAMARGSGQWEGDPGVGEGNSNGLGVALGFGVPRHGARPVGRRMVSGAPQLGLGRAGGDWLQGQQRVWG